MKDKEESKEMKLVVEQQNMKIEELMTRIKNFEKENDLLDNHADKLNRLFKLGVIDEEGNYIGSPNDHNQE